MSPAFAWAAGLLLTGGILFYIFYFQEDVYAAPEKTRLAYLLERKDVVYDNLRDLNFEYKAGKFPETDYQAMKASLELEAANVLAEIDRLESQALRKK
jgi:hypothetical protein